MHHVGGLRRAAYCRRQAYYAEQLDSEGAPDDTYRAVAELAHHYETLVEDPGRAVARAAELADIDADVLHAEVDVESAAESLQLLRGEDPALWSAVTEPGREEVYVEADRLRGTVDKAVETGAGYRASVVKTGSPPRDGVWPSQRVEAAAVNRLLSTRLPVGEEVYVEYPRKGVIRIVELDSGDHERVDELLGVLDSIDDGEPPSRTRNRGKCRSCSYREECGVDSPAVALKQLGGLPSPSEGEGFGSRVTERFRGLFD